MKLLIVAIVCLCAFSAYAADDPAAALGRWVGGLWHGEGKMLDTPMSKAGELHGTTKCAWSPDHVFVVCDQRSSAGGQEQVDISLYTWDPAAKQYRFTGLSQKGGAARTPVFTIDGDIWTYASSFERDGHKTQIRTINTWRDNDTVEFRTEFSIDGGDWKPMNSGVNRRAK